MFLLIFTKQTPPSSMQSTICYEFSSLAGGVRGAEGLATLSGVSPVVYTILQHCSLACLMIPSQHISVPCNQQVKPLSVQQSSSLRNNSRILSKQILGLRDTRTFGMWSKNTANENRTVASLQHRQSHFHDLTMATCTVLWSRNLGTCNVEKWRNAARFLILPTNMWVKDVKRPPTNKS